MISPKDLSAIPLLKSLDETTLEVVCNAARQRAYCPQQILILEGEPCREICFLLQGLARVRQMSLEGREHVLSYLGPGACCNLVSAIDQGPSPATVDALTPVSLAALPCEMFASLVKSHADLAAAVSRQLAADVRRLSEMVRDLALYNVRSRLARFLLEHATGDHSDATRYGSDAEQEDSPDAETPGEAGASSRAYPLHPTRYTQEMIAANIGTVRDVVGRVLRSFVSEGLVRRERGRIIIVDREALEREATGG